MHHSSDTEIISFAQTHSVHLTKHTHTGCLPASFKQSEAGNRKEREEAGSHSQAGNREKKKKHPEPGIYEGKNNSLPKIPPNHLPR